MLRPGGVFFLSPDPRAHYTPPVQTMVGRVLRTTAGPIAALFSLSTPLAAPLTALLMTASSTALAAEPAEAASDEDGPVHSRPLPPDDRTGHVNIFGALGVVVPGGDLGRGVGLAQVANAGPGAEVGVGIGLTRYSGLELRGQFARLGASSACTTCSTQMFATGLGLTYHTSQALGFDPWVRFGFGYRAIVVAGTLTEVANTAPSAGTFHGIDVASLSLGGDFFPVPAFGIGMFFSGDVGVDVSGPSSGVRGAVYGLFQAGLRIALDPQRKPVSIPSGAPRGSTAFVQHSDFGPSLYNRAAK
jgi:hypothetical protein